VNFQKIFKVKFYLLIVLAVLIIGVVNIGLSYLLFSGPLKESKTIIIEQGLSTHQISQKLAEANIVRYPYLFEIIATTYSFKRYLKSGEYEFSVGITPYQILRKLAEGKSVIHKLIIPEGVMVFEILDAVNNNKILSGRLVENVPEGYLMPSTYYYSYGDKREQIIDIMRKEMSAALDKAMEQLDPQLPLKTRKDVLIMASIIEKEAGSDTEKPLIAGVFINRLNKGMKLQADPTTIYALTEGKQKLDRTLTTKDLKIESPYNTYHIFGLPKGPISCPGEKSIMAAVKPAKTDALYFVVNGEGGHAFSNTLNEHNIHVQKYRERVAKAKEEIKDIPHSTTNE
jgi:UPF0755 protein